MDGEELQGSRSLGSCYVLLARHPVVFFQHCHITHAQVSARPRVLHAQHAASSLLCKRSVRMSQIPCVPLRKLRVMEQLLHKHMQFLRGQPTSLACAPQPWALLEQKESCLQLLLTHTRAAAACSSHSCCKALVCNAGILRLPQCPGREDLPSRQGLISMCT